MKKIICLCIGLMMMFLHVQGSNATSTETTGKNILNPNHVTYNEDGFYTTSMVPVKPSTTYVFSMPSNEYLRDVMLKIESRNRVIIETLNDGSNGCKESGDTFYCTFTTSSSTTEIQFNGSTSDQDMKRYFDWTGTMRMQIEEGDTFTGYEPYTVQDSAPPEFQGNGLLLTSYDTVLSVETIMSDYLSAHDEIDGDVSDHIHVISDNYTDHETTVGDYEVVFGVYDSSNNHTEFNLTIRVKDDIAPNIDGPDTLNVNVNNPPSVDALITNNYIFHDGYDSEIQSYTIIEDNYTNNTTELGEKTVTFRITDAAHNQTDHTVTVDIRDTEAPELDVPSSIAWVQSESYQERDLLTYVSATDNHSTQSTIEITIDSHTLPADFNVPGDYTVTYKAVDASLNESIETVLITITDDIRPSLSGPEIIETSYKTPLTLESIKTELTTEDNYKTLTLDDVTVLSNDYHSLESHDPGMYQIVFHVSDTENIDTHTLYIHVVDDVAPAFTFDERIIIDNGSTLSSDDLLLMLLKNADIQAFDPIDLEITDTIKEDDLTYYTVVLTNENAETIEQSIPVETLSPPSEARESFITPIRIVLSLTALTSLIIFIKRFKR
ncbi:MAG: hypothetical protein ACOCU2_02110 [Bacillota bacterium]